jgi:zinc transporter, ZIP family
MAALARRRIGGLMESIWIALFWGAFASAALFIGQALAGPLTGRQRATGLLMGFGAGTLLSAVAYELIPTSDFGAGLGLSVALGALVYFFADQLIDRAGGKHRQDLDGAPPTSSGLAMFLGALLDGLPEAFILGIGIALGEGVSVAFVVAVFVSNVPQGAAGSISLLGAGKSQRTIALMWGWLTIGSALMAAVGYRLADSVPDTGIYAQGFAAGALLVMLADSMMPEAFEHGGRTVGLLTVLGYLAAAVLTAFD